MISRRRRAMTAPCGPPVRAGEGASFRSAREGGSARLVRVGGEPSLRSARERRSGRLVRVGGDASLPLTRERGTRILSRENPPELYVLMDEWVLKRPIGSRQIMHDQLRHLATVARRRRVTVQIVPFDTACTDGLSSSFVIAELEDAPITVSVDSAGEGEVSAERGVASLILDRYDKLRTEAYRAGESLEMIEEAAELWKPET
ncbi:DUF5753 domain-containing protein [Acrocarpospora sp. B8E8]|uniref:DUF5753 domain-containing protein n=1 Tax=Acrocarpospora sp. B8E8 TaxID=3153572 RepID=UPI00325C4697